MIKKYISSALKRYKDRTSSKFLFRVIDITTYVKLRKIWCTETICIFNIPYFIWPILAKNTNTNISLFIVLSKNRRKAFNF